MEDKEKLSKEEYEIFQELSLIIILILRKKQKYIS